MIAKPSDLPRQVLTAVRDVDPLKIARSEIDQCMTDFLGSSWREVISSEDAVALTDIALTSAWEVHR